MAPRAAAIRAVEAEAGVIRQEEEEEEHIPVEVVGALGRQVAEALVRREVVEHHTLPRPVRRFGLRPVEEHRMRPRSARQFTLRPVEE